MWLRKEVLQKFNNISRGIQVGVIFEWFTRISPISTGRNIEGFSSFNVNWADAWWFSIPILDDDGDLLNERGQIY